MSSKVARAMNELHRFMFSNVYFGKAKVQFQYKTKRIEIMLNMLFDYFLKNPSDLGIKTSKNKRKVEQEVIDFIAGMTDPYALSLFKELFLPKGWEE